MPAKKILYFFPENPLENNSGNKTRVLQLLHYFKESGIKVDFVSLLQGLSQWEEGDIEEFKESGLIENIYFVQKKPSKKNRIKYFLNFKIPNYFYKRKLDRNSSLTVDMSWYKKKKFEEILRGSHYDHIIISYLYWADLIENTKLFQGTKTIVDIHDFLTLHHLKDKKFKLGATFEDEINKLNQFDEVWTVSSDEQFIFSQFCKSIIRLIPPFFTKPSKGKPWTEKTYDLVYVASNNSHNQLSIDWFFKKVYPLLPPDHSICIIGRISDYIGNYPNVHKITYTENLQEHYESSKIALCPMLSGTGVKIKVVEALSHGLPVVCNSRGMDGLPNKINNGCLVSDDPEEFAQHIIYLINHQHAYDQQSRMGEELFNSHFESQKVRSILNKVFMGE
ncbi:MAG: glycosyltransferase [Anditalea sp.]